MADMVQKLCEYGATNYWLFDDSSVRVGRTPENSQVVYTITPIKRGYREFMSSTLANAMEENNLFY